MKRLTISILTLSVSLIVLLTGFLTSAKPTLAFSSDFTGIGGNYLTREESDYNYLPILLSPNSSTGNTGQLRDKISYNLAYDQGYEAQCAKEAWEITPQVYGSISDYFNRYSTPITLSNSASYELNFENATVPLFRGDEEYTETKKISSFEGFFGASDPEADQEDVLTGGVTTQLLSKQQQCVVKYGNLFSMFSAAGFCSKMENPDQCVVDYEIDRASLTTKELYENLSEYFSRKVDGEKFSCDQMTRSWDPEYEEFDISRSEFEKTSLALDLMPLNTDRLYRLAFLVISPQQNPNQGGSIFSFLQQDGNSVPDKNRFAPIVIAFKVPHLATNHIISLPFLRDAANITSYGFEQANNLEKFFIKAEGDRADYLDDIIEGKNAKPVINCDGMPQCINNEENALTLSLVDLINGSKTSSGLPNKCSNFNGPYEQAGELGSPAKTDEDKRFSIDGAISLASKSERNFSWRILVRNEGTQEDLRQESMPIMAHIVSPYGTDMKYLTNAMQSLFNDQEFETIVENNCIPDYQGVCGVIPEFLTIGGAIAELDSQSDSQSFIYDTDNEKSLGGTIGENPENPLIILGGELGFMIRKVQESLRQIGSKTYEYVRSCERTEDLFLGRCQGYLGNPGGNDSSEQPADSCDDFRGTTVEVPTMSELENLVCDVAGNNARDAQLLWGLMQVDGSPFLRQVRQEVGEMSCGDLIVNSCGASQIVGILVPHCIDTSACSQATSIAESEQLRRDITPSVACSVQGSLEYILEVRKNETSYLREEYRNARGREATEEQLYYMYAARNYGLQPEVFIEDACSGAPAVQGCDGANYCECVMDTFSFSCS